MTRTARHPAAARAEDQAARSGKTAAAEPAQPTQRERLLEAMVELASETGYQAITIAQLSSRAGVSSATFYEQFEGKEECLLAAYRALAARVFGELQRTMAGGALADVLPVALGGLLVSVRDDPHAGRLLFIEALAGGPRLREEIKRLLGEFEHRAEAFLDAQAPDGPTLDVPAIAIVGAVRSIVARHLRTHSEDLLPSLLDDMLAWMHSYAVAPGTERWSASASARLPRSPLSEPTPTQMPRLPRGRHGLPASVVARSQRTRILHGTAEVMLAKGYAEATVSDIVAASGVAREAFYQHFTDKQDAFLEAQQHPTQYILDACVAAYFAEEEWPARVWSGLKTLLELIAENPAESHLRLVECYAAGPAAARRAEDITRSFTIFLEEGYRCSPQARALPRLFSQTIAGAVFEIVQRAIARGDSREVPRYLPQLAYLAIAPFTGPQEAIRLLGELRAGSDFD
jgi:AcrR family transcriptional regulator